MNGPPTSQIERRGATGSPDGGSSLLFFGGIIVGIALLGTGALAIWGPEKDVSSKTEKLASDPHSADPLPSLPPEPVVVVPSADPAPTELPPDPPPADSAGKKGKKKVTTKGGKKH